QHSSTTHISTLSLHDALPISIGNDGWYVRGGKRARYDQQPIEACAMVDVWLAAYRLGGDYSYLDRARASFAWFLGRNTERLVVRSEEHTSEVQSPCNLVCRLL